MLKNRSTNKVSKLEQEIDSKHYGIYAWGFDSEEEREKTRKMMKEQIRKNKRQ